VKIISEVVWAICNQAGDIFNLFSIGIIISFISTSYKKTFYKSILQSSINKQMLNISVI